MLPISLSVNFGTGCVNLKTNPSRLFKPLKIERSSGPKGSPVVQDKPAYLAWEKSKVCKGRYYSDCCRSDDGIADVFVQIMGDYIKTYGESYKDCYILDFKSNMWNKMDSSFIVDEMLEPLRDILEFEHREFIYKINNGPSLSDYEKGILENKADKCWELHEKFNKTSAVNGSLKSVKRRLCNNDFPDKLDKNPYILSVANGIVDLKTGELRNRTKEDFCTFECQTPYCKDSDIKEIENIILQICGDDVDKKNCLQRILGYCITGIQLKEYMLFLLGDSNKGKSIITELFNSALGFNYCRPLSKDVLIDPGGKRSSGSHTAHLANIGNVRTGIITELKQDSKSSGEWKQSDNAIVVRDCGEKEKIIRPFLKYLVNSNYPPKVDPDDNGAWNRILEFSFGTTFMTQEQLDIKFVQNFMKTEEAEQFNGLQQNLKLEKDLDRQKKTDINQRMKQILDSKHEEVIKNESKEYVVFKSLYKIRNEKLKDEVKSLKYAVPFLKWLIIGAKEFLKNGLQLTDQVKNDTRELRKSQDLWGAFIDDNLKITDNPDDRINASELFQLGVSYSEQAHLTQTKFGQLMSQKGLEKKHFRNGWYYIGVVMKPIYEIAPVAGNTTLKYQLVRRV